MSKVLADIEETILVNDEGYDVDSISATCRDCGHQTESFGTSSASELRCLALLREECPRGENNYYEAP